MFNSNFQIQDADGVIVCDMWKSPYKEVDGPVIVEALNGGGHKVAEVHEVSVGVGEETSGNGSNLIEEGLSEVVVRKKLPKAERRRLASERMKAYWAAKRAK